MVRTLISAIILSAVAPPLESLGDCRQFFVQKQQVAYVQPVYYPPVYYAAGRDIEAEALAEKVAKLVAHKLALRDQQSNLPRTREQQAAQSLLSQVCGKCHTGPNPKGGLTIDGETPMSCESILESISSVASGKMPQGIKLTPEQKGQVLDELLGLRKKSTPVPPLPEGELK